MRTVMILAAAVLIGCSVPTGPIETETSAEIPAQEEPMSDPITVTPEEPTFQPDPLTVYILDTDGEVYLSELCTDANYASRLRAYQLSVELYNRDEKTGHPFTAVGGGTE
jgi:hypothetical protein